MERSRWWSTEGYWRPAKLVNFRRWRAPPFRATKFKRKSKKNTSRLAAEQFLGQFFPFFQHFDGWRIPLKGRWPRSGRTPERDGARDLLCGPLEVFKAGVSSEAGELSLFSRSGVDGWRILGCVFYVPQFQHVSKLIFRAVAPEQMWGMMPNYMTCWWRAHALNKRRGRWLICSLGGVKFTKNPPNTGPLEVQLGAFLFPNAFIQYKKEAQVIILTSSHVHGTHKTLGTSACLALPRKTQKVNTMAMALWRVNMGTTVRSVLSEISCEKVMSKGNQNWHNILTFTKRTNKCYNTIKNMFLYMVLKPSKFVFKMNENDKSCERNIHSFSESTLVTPILHTNGQRLSHNWGDSRPTLAAPWPSSHRGQKLAAPDGSSLHAAHALLHARRWRRGRFFSLDPTRKTKTSKCVVFCLMKLWAVENLQRCFVLIFLMLWTRIWKFVLLVFGMVQISNGLCQLTTGIGTSLQWGCWGLGETGTWAFCVHKISRPMPQRLSANKRWKRQPAAGAVDLGMFWFLKALPENLEAGTGLGRTCPFNGLWPNDRCCTFCMNMR